MRRDQIWRALSKIKRHIFPTKTYGEIYTECYNHRHEKRQAKSNNVALSEFFFISDVMKI